MNPTLVTPQVLPPSGARGTWKERSEKTHQKHLQMYQGKHFKTAFLGDSMTERWLSTGKSEWMKFENCANLGVGGDKIGNLLYRMIARKECAGILDVITAECVIIMIGTNDLEKRSSRGIMNIVSIVRKKLDKTSITVYGLLNRSDIDSRKISELNSSLKDAIMAKNDHLIQYRFFGDKVNSLTILFI